ncbi:class I SAM-dependent methyltransferase [Chthonobacter rhizosphaerae]|uniref:class I SAM-dependent methyltransferase n=1 Tax=Chthonobacter rhizosphaerae TaxID=2735553 RepID=UPI0015EF663C|nr:class I SAM-dependent methyltransferase [Chthonobacter rhizosphaerae]
MTQDRARAAREGETAIETAMRATDVISAYARWAPVYDLVFGLIMESSRRAAVAALKPDTRRVLEVGVGTGISLPDYPSSMRVTGIDLSPDMLAKARERIAAKKLSNVEAILEMDAARLEFADDSFDCAMAMYVMTVVPDPARVMAEMRRIVRPGGRILAVSHFAPEDGLRAKVGGLLSPMGRLLGWNTTIRVSTLAALPGVRLLSNKAAGLGGFYRLLEFEVVK